MTFLLKCFLAFISPKAPRLMRRCVRFLAALLCLLLASCVASLPSAAQPLDLILPTGNDALLRGDGPAFYQYTNRIFEGRRSTPWQGGQYGFVRNARRSAGGDVIFTRFHEGVDIQAVRRDERGEPLDDVRAIDDGRVAYVNSRASRSNYGIYVVVEHVWDGASFYSLYAHLSRADVETGDRVEQGDRLGRMGYTGRGLGQERAHVHFEINMLLSRDFEAWLDKHHPTWSNRHGLFNGRNLRGLDVAALYQSLQVDPDLTIGAFLAAQPRVYTVAVPRTGPLGLLERYPWLARHMDRVQSPAWDISFTQAGLPVAFTPAVRAVTTPVFVPSGADPQRPCRRPNIGVLRRDGDTCVLTKNGQRFIELLMTPGTQSADGQAW